MVDFRGALAQQLLSRGAQGGNTVGQGLSSIGASIGGALLARQAQQADEARTLARNEAFAPIIAALSGGTPGTLAAAPGGGPGAPLSLAGPRQPAPGAAPVQMADASGGAGFSTGGGLDRNAALIQLLSNPDLLADPRAAALLPMLTPPGPDTVSPAREAQLLRLRPPAAQTSINVDARGNKLPPPPAGFMYEAGPAGETTLVAIPGGPAAIRAAEAATEAAGAEEQAAAKVAGQQTQAGLLAEEIERARDLVINPGLLPNAGAVGSLLSNIGGTDAGDLGQLLTTISANISFDRLQQMRDNSPTGGALGQVTPRELELLAATQGSLAQSQSTPQLLFNLDRMAETFNQIVHGNSEGGPVTPSQGAVSEGATATNPDTGEQLIFRNGQWVPVNG